MEVKDISYSIQLPFHRKLRGAYLSTTRLEESLNKSTYRIEVSCPLPVPDLVGLVQLQISGVHYKIREHEI